MDGIAYSRESIDQLHSTLCAWQRENQTAARAVTYVNPHVFNLARKNAEVRALLARADMVAVDGLGFALAVRLLNGECQTRTVMTPLLDRVLASEGLPRLAALLIGGDAPAVALGAAAMNRASKNIEVVQTCTGYASVQEYLALFARHPGIDLVLIAMGTPRSEELMLAAIDAFPGKLFWNIGGGTLHFYAGTKRRAPHWVSAAGLQWFWRMVFEPATVPRYLTGIPIFCARIARLLVSRNNHAPL